MALENALLAIYKLANRFGKGQVLAITLLLHEQPSRFAFSLFRFFSIIMRSNRKILMGVLIAAGALVVWRLVGALNPSDSSPVAPDATPLQVAAKVPASGQYVAAAREIPAGSIVTRDMLELVDPVGALPFGAILDPDAQAVGYITRFAIKRGEAVRPTSFIGHISEVGIAGALRPDTRALVVPIANKPTLHDLVKIGNYVDVLAAFDGQESRAIVQNVRVLAVDVFANDFPQVNGAMRGPFKADARGRGVATSPAAPRGPLDPNAATEPTPLPTPIPANAPRPDPALTLEVTPQQAAAIQLALASNSPLDFLVRPAAPANGAGEVTLVGDDGLPLAGTVPPLQNVSVTKAQIAPYAERKKAQKEGGNAARSTRGSGNSDFTPPRSRGVDLGGLGGPVFPPPGESPKVTPVIVPKSNTDEVPAKPAPPAKYEIPIYADGRVVRTETVPLPAQ